MGYYPNTIKFVREILKKECPRAKVKANLKDPASPSHLLWMLREIEQFEDVPGLAGRWIGYVLRAMEEKKLLNNQQSRDIVRKDVSEGHG